MTDSESTCASRREDFEHKMSLVYTKVTTHCRMHGVLGHQPEGPSRWSSCSSTSRAACLRAVSALWRSWARHAQTTSFFKLMVYELKGCFDGTHNTHEEMRGCFDGRKKTRLPVKSYGQTETYIYIYTRHTTFVVS